MRALPLLAGFLALAACVPAARTPAPTPAPVQPQREAAPAPRPAPIASDWNDWPWTPGTWTYRRDARGSIALFGTAGADALVTLRCQLPERQVYLSRAGTATTPITVRTSSTTRALTPQPTGGTPAYVAVPLAPQDTLLDAIGFSRGRFIVEQAGVPPLVIPPWAEVERVTEDCRG